MRSLTYLKIHWSRLEANWNLIQSLAPKAKILPMIKANAYGHGIEEVGCFLSENLGAEALGVATLGEAERVKDFGKPVYVFSENLITGFVHHPRYDSVDLKPVLHDLKSLEIFLSSDHFKKHDLVLKLNTGMNRLGISPSQWEEAIGLIKKSGRTSIQHLMSHFSTSYYQEKPNDMIHRQMDSFRSALDLFTASGLKIDETSMANSGAIEQRLMCDQSWVRPGLMLYGPPSFKGETKMISSLVTHVMRVDVFERGTPIGYGIHVTPEKGVVALLPIGYGDGFSTQSSGHKISINGQVGKVFGRVNMDMCAVFFPIDALNKINVGDEARLWDENPQDLLNWSQHMQTNAYQAMCGISSRVPREYCVG
jgi:alanine racemase